MMPIADYFLAAFCQYANLVNQSSAKRAAAVITEVISGTLTRGQKAMFYELLPTGLSPSSHQFYLHLSRRQSRFDKLDWAKEISRRLSLTDQAEVNNLLQGYFKSVKELSDPQNSAKLACLMPAELGQIFEQA